MSLMSRRSVAIGASAALLILGIPAVGFFFLEERRGHPEEASAPPPRASRGSEAVRFDRDARGDLPSDSTSGARAAGITAGGSSALSGVAEAPVIPSRPSGGASTVQAASATSGGPTSAEFWKTLGAGTSAIRLLVTGAEGEPLAGAVVEIGSDTNWRNETTDGAGVAELGNIAAGSYQVLVKPTDRPGLSIKSGRDVSVREGETVEIRLRIPAFDAEIAGRVLDASGLPLRNIQVVASSLPLSGGGTRFSFDTGLANTARTEADGRFRLAGLARVEHLVSTRDCAPYSVGRATALAGSGEPIEMILTKVREIDIRGTVSDPEGDPVMGATVRSSTHGGPQVETSSEGRFHLLLVHSKDSVGLVAAKEGFTKAEVSIPSNEVEEGAELEVNLSLEPLGETASLAGVVLDAHGSPLRDQVVHIHSGTFGSVHQARTGANGAYEISGVSPAANYRVWVSPTHSFQDFQQAPIDLLGGENSLDITLEPLDTGRLSGVLRDGSGQAARHWTLWARSAKAGANSVSITTDSSGRFSSEEVPCGSLTLETRASPHLSIRGLELKADEPLEVDLVVGIGGGSLSGAVAAASGSPVARAKVALTWSRADRNVQSIAYREAQTDAGGRFAFSGLASGRAELVISAEGFKSARKRLDLTGGAEEVSFSLDPAGQ